MEKHADLIEAALKARNFACAHYSSFKVGAAILSREGAIFTGCNVESASFGLTCCAERVALFKALSEGVREFTAITVTASVTGGPMPCGACRQLLVEYAGAAMLLTVDSRTPAESRKFLVAELLPDAFLSFA